MDKLRKQLEDLKKALKRFKEALKIAHEYKGKELYPFFRDSAIQRFEFTYEIFWKTVKTALKEIEGIECVSPKSCFRELFSTGYVNEETARELLKMVDSRNLTVHTYKEEVAEEIFRNLDKYSQIIELVMKKVEERSKDIFK